MENLTFYGRMLFVIAVVAFGIEHFAFGNTLTALILIPDTAPAFSLWIYSLGLIFLGAGICIAAEVRTQLTATLLGILFLVLYLIFHFPREIANPKDPGAWTAAFELIGMSGGAFMLAKIHESTSNRLFNYLNRAGVYLFASTFVVIGIQHILYAEFIATLIPAWIPGPLFWAYFVGIVFFAVALALIIRIRVGLTTTLLGIMFLTWVLILHGPRAFASVHTETEWTSLFIALAMGGISLMIAGSPSKIYKAES
jgi:uncharacterized membrane protein